MPDNISALYGALKKNDFQVPENEDDFRKAIQNPKIVNELHSALKQNDFQVPESVNDFSSWLNPTQQEVKKKEETPSTSGGAYVRPLSQGGGEPAQSIYEPSQTATTQVGLAKGGIRGKSDAQIMAERRADAIANVRREQEKANASGQYYGTDIVGITKPKEEAKGTAFGRNLNLYNKERIEEGKLVESVNVTQTTPPKETSILDNINISAKQTIDNIANSWEQGQIQGKEANVLNINELVGKGLSDQQIADIAKLESQKKKIGQTFAMDEWNKAQGIKESVSAFLKNPVDVAIGLALPSISALVRHGASRVATGTAIGATAGSVVPAAGTLAGAGLGATAGMITSGINLEYANSILESLGEAGIDISNEKALRNGFSDEKKMSEARKYALKRGVPIAIVDIVTGGLAGKLTNIPAKNIIKKAAKTAAELGIQVGGGAGGEALAQLSSKGYIDSKEVLGEAFGEFGSGVGEVVIGGATYNKPKEKATTPPMEGEAPPPAEGGAPPTTPPVGGTGIAVEETLEDKKAKAGESLRNLLGKVATEEKAVTPQGEEPLVEGNTPEEIATNIQVKLNDIKTQRAKILGGLPKDENGKRIKNDEAQAQLDDLEEQEFRLQEYDSQNKQRVSGEVGEGQKPIETQPIGAGGKEAVAPSGVLQTPTQEVIIPDTPAGHVTAVMDNPTNDNIQKLADNAVSLGQEVIRQGNDQGTIPQEKMPTLKETTPVVESIAEPTSTSTPVSDIEGQIGTSNYSVDKGLIFYNNPNGTVTPVDNPEGKPVMEVITADIEKRRQEDLKNLNKTTLFNGSDRQFVEVKPSEPVQIEDIEGKDEILVSKKQSDGTVKVGRARRKENGLWTWIISVVSDTGKAMGSEGFTDSELFENLASNKIRKAEAIAYRDYDAELDALAKETPVAEAPKVEEAKAGVVGGDVGKKDYEMSSSEYEAERQLARPVFNRARRIANTILDWSYTGGLYEKYLNSIGVKPNEKGLYEDTSIYDIEDYMKFLLKEKTDLFTKEDYNTYLKYKDFMDRDIDPDWQNHETRVSIAFWEGKKVPSEVLKEYPELYKQQSLQSTPQAESPIAEVAVAEAPKTETTDALKDVESTAKALDDVLSNKKVKVDKAKLKKVNNEISKLIDIDNKEPKLKKIKEQGGNWRKLFNESKDTVSQNSILRAVVETSNDVNFLNEAVDITNGLPDESNTIADILQKNISDNNKAEIVKKVLSGDYKKNTKFDVLNWLEYNKGVKRLIPKDLLKKLEVKSDGQLLSEAYHADKATGKETELTKAVEELLGKLTETPKAEAKPSEVTKEPAPQKAETKAETLEDKKAKAGESLRNLLGKTGVIKNIVPSEDSDTWNDIKNIADYIAAETGKKGKELIEAIKKYLKTNGGEAIIPQIETYEKRIIAESSQEGVETTEPTNIRIFEELDAMNEKRMGIGNRAKENKAFNEKHGNKAQLARDITNNFEKYIDKLLKEGIIVKVKC